MSTSATPSTPTAATPPTKPIGTSWRVVAAAAFTVVAWASAFVVIRYVGQDYSAGGLSLGRLIVGSACLSLIMALGRRWVPMTAREWGLVTLIGVLWFGVYSV